MIKILLAAGHGAGDNRGGVCYNEGDNNYHYSLALKKELDTYKDVQVDLLRENITDNPILEDRAKAGAGYDLYLAIHSNAFNNPEVRGTEVFDSVEKPNLNLAKLICDITAGLFGHNNRGVKYREGQPGYNWYGELRFNQAKSAMIAEMGFHTNINDCSFFKNNHRELAVVQARSIASHYELKKKAIKEDEHWGEKIYQRLADEGLKIDEKRFDDNMIRAEGFALAEKIINWMEGKYNV